MKKRKKDLPGLRAAPGKLSLQPLISECAGAEKSLETECVTLLFTYSKYYRYQYISVLKSLNGIISARGFKNCHSRNYCIYPYLFSILWKNLMKKYMNMLRIRK